MPDHEDRAGRRERRARRRGRSEGRRVQGPDGTVYRVRAVTAGTPLEPDAASWAAGQSQEMSTHAAIQHNPVAGLALLGAPVMRAAGSALGRVLGRRRWSIGVLAYTSDAPAGRLVHREAATEATVEARIGELVGSLERHGDTGMR